MIPASQVSIPPRMLPFFFSTSHFCRWGYLYSEKLYKGVWKSANGRWGEVKRTELFQNFPNPFNPETWIPFSLSKPKHVLIGIYTSTGQLVRTPDLGQKLSGVYLSKEKAAYWDGRNDVGEQVASSAYFYTIQAGDFTATKKMVVAE
jgi:hypothetical protein